MNVLKEVHNLLTEKMNEADENNSRYDDDQDFSEMISADQIDQMGNIIDPKAKKEEGLDKNMEEEEEEEEEYEG